MGTSVRPEISKNKRYFITRHRYYELLHFCRQYNDYIKEIKELETNVLPSIILNDIKGSDISDSTSKLAIKISELRYKIDIINECIKEMDEGLGDYIFEAVTEGTPYSILEAKGMPCSKNTFYDRYRKFFWLLDKKK